jgi:hypothetical protein
MQTVTTIGLDIAKSAFQFHGVNADGNVVLRRLRASLVSRPVRRHIMGRANFRRSATPCA